MDIILEKTRTISELSTGLVFDIGQGRTHRELHQQALSLLLQVNDLEQMITENAQKATPKVLSEAEQQAKEINKVGRKLKRWAQNRGQVNTRLLAHFLELRRQGHSTITKLQMEAFAERERIKNFNSNFFGMNHIGPKNHGKVFDVIDGVVTIWPPVLDAVEQFERQSVVDAAVREEGPLSAEAAISVEIESTQSEPVETAPAVTEPVVAELSVPQELQRAAVVQSDRVEPPEVQRSGGDGVMSEADIESIYSSFKSLWLKRVEFDVALEQLEQLGVERSGAEDCLEALELMMRGEAYPKPLEAAVVRYFVEHIRADFSRGYLGRVRSAISAHLDQQEMVGNPQPAIRSLLSLYQQ